MIVDSLNLVEHVHHAAVDAVDVEWCKIRVIDEYRIPDAGDSLVG